MTINKQFYEDACKLIEQPNGWLKSFNFGKNGEGIGIELLDEAYRLAIGEANCWCMNGALLQVIVGADKDALREWLDGSNYDDQGEPIPPPEKYKVFREHQNALSRAFRNHTKEGENFVYYNDCIAKSGQEMANKVREIVAKMED